MKHSSQNELPAGFLQGPPPSNITVDRIDFKKMKLPMYDGLYAVVLDNVLTPQECETMVRAAEASTTSGWERAMINVGGGEQMLMTDQRNCGRIIWDSRDIVDSVWKRIGHLPDVQEITRLENVAKITGNGPAKWKEVWNFTRPNERMRFLKYQGGEYFRPHCDGKFDREAPFFRVCVRRQGTDAAAGSYETPDRSERSYFTLHLYLNNADVTTKDPSEATEGDIKSDSVLVGGATTFHAHVSACLPIIREINS